MNMDPGTRRTVSFGILVGGLVLGWAMWCAKGCVEAVNNDASGYRKGQADTLEDLNRQKHELELENKK